MIMNLLLAEAPVGWGLFKHHAAVILYEELAHGYREMARSWSAESWYCCDLVLEKDG